MNWELLTGPVIGAVIGYVTNKIAVDMLFRPLKPIYIGKFHVPFTPGIIPKGKDRLGKAIGDAVGNNLLTSDTIQRNLLSEKMENSILDRVELFLTNTSLDQTQLETKLNETLGEQVTAEYETKIKSALTTKINNGLIEMNIGDIIGNEAMIAVSEKVKGTMLAIMVNSTTLTPIIEEIKKRINKYVEEHGEEKIGEFMDKEFEHILQQPISFYASKLDANEMKEIVRKIYRNLVTNYAKQLFDHLNFSNIVQDKVSAMDVKEVEQLVLSIMEKELGAVVNLGAIIGFLLGLFNILF